MIISTSKYHLAERCLQRGWDIEEVMGCVVTTTGDLWTIDTDHPDYPQDYHPTIPHIGNFLKELKEKQNLEIQDMGGPGTELKKILGKFGIVASPKCSCTQRMKIMNDKGNEWCRENIDYIVGWLEEEAHKRKLPFMKFLGKKLVNMAIKRSEKIQAAE